MAVAKISLILLVLFLFYLGYKKILGPLLMVTMGTGIAMVNVGILVMPNTGEIGTIFLNALVETPAEHIDAFQIYFLQPIYALSFSNGLIGCLIFIAIGSILTFPIAMCLGFDGNESASISIIGGVDGPMVLFASLQLAKQLFVPITIVAYIYSSINYAGYPFLLLVLLFIFQKKKQSLKKNICVLSTIHNFVGTFFALLLMW